MKKLNRNLAANRASKQAVQRRASASNYPFAAIVGQEEMKLGLVLNVIDPSIGGVLIMGHRGTGKSTAVRGLADLLPEIWVVKDCPYRCDPADLKSACYECHGKLNADSKPKREKSRVTVVELPLGATEDRICGAIDIQRALSDGVKAFDPGLLARANRSFLYIDEVNLLEDHLVDLLLDVAVTGQNQVERENISVTHPARFVLIGSGNPEEGELRPQLLDRFGLSVEVTTELNLDERVEIVERRQAYDRDPMALCQTFAADQERLSKRITAAQRYLRTTKLDRSLLRKIAELCSELKVDGHRGELTISRGARALAAFEGRKKVGVADVKRVAPMALRHRLRRDPLEETAESDRIQQAMEKVFAEKRTTRARTGNDEGGDGSSRSLRPVENSGEQEVERPQRARAASREAVGGDGERKLTEPVRDSAVRFPKLSSASQTSKSRQTSRTNYRAGANAIRNQLRGRYVRATEVRKEGSRVALDATLRTSLSRPRSAASLGRQISSDDFRFKELSCKTGRLHIFVIDTSGSMAVHRIRQAKGAVLNLLKRSYVQRDYVAIVGFGGIAAEIYLPPSRSILRARRVLDSLRVGGGTPLSSGLACALELSKRVRGKLGEISLLVFTDGNANVPHNSAAGLDRFQRQTIIDNELRLLRAGFTKECVNVTVVDTENSFMGAKNAVTIARRLGAHYQILPIKAGNRSTSRD
jgi:magnesium chelatase subunit D